MSISNELIAHDLAVAKLSGSSLSTEELVLQYQNSYEEILEYLSNVSEELAECKEFRRTC